MSKYIDATEDQGKVFYQEFHDKGKVVMLNLLRFRRVADYVNATNLKPANEISGKEAYDRYLESTLPHLSKAGSKVLFYGSCNKFLIGPTTEHWDAMLLVEHQSVQKFIEFSRNEDYLKGAGHRTAALEDSRLLPITEKLIEGIKIAT